jgi:hypothetical protein
VSKIWIIWLGPKWTIHQVSRRRPVSQAPFPGLA